MYIYFFLTEGRDKVFVERWDVFLHSSAAGEKLRQNNEQILLLTWEAALRSSEWNPPAEEPTDRLHDKTLELYARFNSAVISLPDACGRIIM